VSRQVPVVVIREKKVKHLLSTIPIMSTIRAITSQLNPLNIENQTTTYNVGNHCPVLGQSQKCGGLNQLLGSKPFSIDN
jgi:hypothetical protein